MRVVHLCFLFTLLLLPLGQVARLQFLNHINASFFDIGVLVTGLVWMGYVFVRRKAGVKGWLTKPILLFFLTILLSLAANVFRYDLSELAVSSLYAIRWLCYAATYAILVHADSAFRNRITFLLVAVGSMLLLFGYLQFIFYSNLRNLYYLGWDEHLYRMFSTFLDPNFFGAFLVLFLLFLLGIVLEKKPTGVRSLFAYVIMSAAFFGIFLTTSRSAILMLVIGLGTFLVLMQKTKLLLVMTGVILLIIVAASPLYHIENINPFRVTSSLARVESAENALHIIAENSIFGVGFNAYRYAQYEYGFRERESVYPNHADSGTDNSFLFVFATTGIIGLSAFCYFLVKVYQLGKVRRPMMGVVLISSLAGLIVSSLFNNTLFYPFLLYWLFAVAGLTDYT